MVDLSISEISDFFYDTTPLREPSFVFYVNGKIVKKLINDEYHADILEELVEDYANNL
jgi:hypothetical protein